MIRQKDFAASSKSLTLIALVSAIAALYFGRHLLIPLALGMVFSFMLTPFVSQLEKLRIGRVPSVLTVLLLSLAMAGTVSWAVAGQLVEVVSEIPDFKYNLDAKIQSFRASKTGNFSKATATVQELNKELASVPGQIASVGNQEKGAGAARRPIAVQVTAPPSNIVQDLRDLLGPLAGVLETALIVTIFTIFMLLKREDLRNRAIRLAGRGQLTVMTQALDDAGRRLSRYLLMQLTVNTGYGLLFGAGLYFIGVPHAFLWGVLAALLRFVPYVGVLAAAAFPIAMALAVFPGWRQAGLTFGTFLVLEFGVSNFLEPLLYGGNTGISSLAILVAAVFWTTLWGPVGLILSTPLTVCLIILGRYVPQLSFLEVALGDEPVLTPAQCYYQRLLAMDQEEARAVAEAHLKQYSLEGVYDSIFVPALKLAEQDHSVDGIDDDTWRFMLRSTKEFVEDMGERFLEEHNSDRKNDSKDSRGEPEFIQRTKIVCVPARSGPDSLAAKMLMQLLQVEGYNVRFMKFGSAESLVAELSQGDCDVVCVSAFPPFAIGQARSLCRKLQSSFPGLRIIVGLWGIDEGGSAVKERLGTGCPGVVSTTLKDALAEVRRIADPDSAGEAFTPPGEALAETSKP